MKSTICRIEIQKIIKEKGLRLLLINLDPKQIPAEMASHILMKLYSVSYFEPEVLKSISNGLFYVVKHLEYICQMTIFLQKKKQRIENLFTKNKHSNPKEISLFSKYMSRKRNSMYEQTMNPVPTKVV